MENTKDTNVYTTDTNVSNEYNSKEPTALTKRRAKIKALLEECPRSVTELTIITGFCDPRSYIRYLRDSGVTVTDEWKKSADGARYKVYYIPPRQSGR